MVEVEISMSTYLRRLEMDKIGLAHPALRDICRTPPNECAYRLEGTKRCMATKFGLKLEEMVATTALKEIYGVKMSREISVSITVCANNQLPMALPALELRILTLQ